MQTTATSYHEPSIIPLLILTSFLFLLNTINHVINNLLNCGLISQVLLGTLYGPPLLSWLDRDITSAILPLGYVGLILLVYEGGLSTSISRLLSNILLSTVVALTGISLPIALSFLLRFIADAGWAQCFGAGAALSATSLGTTFTVLSTADLTGTRLGTVLTSAAMMDDVVGLVMIQVVSSLGAEGRVSVAQAVGRPVGASVGLLLVTVALCWASKFVSLPGRRDFACIFHTLFLTSFVVAACYAGTSMLFAAFLAGAALSWVDERTTDAHVGGLQIYEELFKPAVERILIPFFFASIGFSIPIRQMFHGSTVWRGIVYATLMLFGKVFTGVWLLLPKYKPTISIAEKRSKSLRILPAAILGFAMVARGEIAFLIASVADAGGIFKGNEELYLIVIWAAVLNTIVGPIVVGLWVRRVKKGGLDLLGLWGDEVRE